MTETELIEYYKENKNSANEISLIGKNSNLKFIFRHYIEYFTGKDKWLRIDEGVIFSTESLILFYDVGFQWRKFSDIEDVRRVLSESGCYITLHINDGVFMKFTIHKRHKDRREYYLISHTNDDIYTMCDLYHYGYEYKGV